jgi:hypothetical protein
MTMGFKQPWAERCLLVNTFMMLTNDLVQRKVFNEKNTDHFYFIFSPQMRGGSIFSKAHNLTTIKISPVSSIKLSPSKKSELSKRHCRNEEAVFDR